MRVDTIRKLFAGVRIDGRMREQLEKCPPRDRVFFESADGRYLTVVRGGDDTYIGKILEPSIPLNGIDDVRRNIWSILQRVCPGRRDESEVKLFALDDADVEPTFSASPVSRTASTRKGPATHASTHRASTSARCRTNGAPASSQPGEPSLWTPQPSLFR